MPFIPKIRPRVRVPHIRPRVRIRPPHIRTPHIRIRPHIRPRIRPHIRPHVRPRIPRRAVAPRTVRRGIVRPRTIPHRSISKRTVSHNIPKRTAIHPTPKRTIKNEPKRVINNKTPIREQPKALEKELEKPKSSWKDKLKSALDWGATLGSLGLTGLMAYEMLGGGNEASAEQYPEDYGYGDYGYGDSEYGDYGYGDYGGGYGGYGGYGGGYEDYGYGDYGAFEPYKDEGSGLDDLISGETTETGEEQSPENYYPVDDNGDGEPEYYYNPDTGEMLTPEEYAGLNQDNGVLGSIDKKVESLSNKTGIPKEAIYIGGALAVLGGIYYIMKHKKRKKA